MRPAPEYPRIYAAMEEAEGNLWNLADALVTELGQASEGKANDGSRTRLEEVARGASDRGFDYDVTTLAKLRLVATRFLAGGRPASVWTCADAGDPEVLEEAIRRNGGKPVTGRFVRQFRRELREQEEAAERKRQADRRRRAEDAERKHREAAQAARDERERREAQERARKAEQRRQQLEQEQAEVERKREERKRKEADAKAERLARELEDKDVAEALARNKSVGARRVTNAVHEREAARRRKVRDENEHRRNAEALPLPAFVPKMIGEIDGWAIAMRGITDDDLAGLPEDDPMVRQLANVVEELNEQSRRWLIALGRGDLQLPEFELIEGIAQ